jgi:L-alanine-DL-glutamate epimerase-like enolase superfamily enzyme
MKITDLRLTEYEGVMETEGTFWEERLVRPIDIYPEHRAEGAGYTAQIEPGKYRIRAVFLEVLSDGGVTGMSGPFGRDVAAQIAGFRSLLVGKDPRAHELIWDQLYRHAVHGRKGGTMMAISAVDCALWDLKGKWANAPVCALLGGPTRQEVPAYASALGYSLEAERVAERARQIVADGYRHTKWFFRHGTAEGRDGMARNEALARTLRDAVGEDVEIMLDAWMSWDVPYTIAMAERLHPFRPAWIEEPVLPDRIDACADIRRSVRVPIATGEHEYTRWGHKALIDAGAADILQPDIYWAGGISEVLKICTLASVADLPVIPHGHSVPATLHLIASQPPNVCPLLEYLVKWNAVHQFFFKEPVTPRNGVVRVPTAPGIGFEIDPDKVDRSEDLKM